MSRAPDYYKFVPEAQVLLRAWDPIGVYSMFDDCPPDEYDSYAPGVISVLMRDGTVEELAAHLQKLRMRDMAQQANWNADLATAVALKAAYDKFSTPNDDET